jgi:tRNA(His) 5'-end guanylyltransferase
VAEVNSMTATDAALKKYLGKGFDISNYDTFCDTEKAVLTDLLLPNKLFYDTSDEICRRGNDTQYSYTEYKKRMVKLEAMVSSSIAIAFAANWVKDVSLEQDFKYEVEAMFTTTVSFDKYLIENIPTL